MIISITNLKGGVGKSTIATNLAVCFAHMGKSVCIVDTDTNQSAMSWVENRDEQLPNVTVTGVTNAKVAGQTISAMGTKYDIVIVDGTPNVSEMTTRIILASDFVLIPIQASPLDFNAMPMFFERYEQAKEFRGEIPAFFILNRVVSTKIQKGIKDLLPNFGIGVLQSTLANRTAYADTQLSGIGVIEYSDEKAKSEMMNLINEIIEKLNNL